MSVCEVSRLSGSTCDTPHPRASSEGQLTRLNRKLSFTLVFGTFSCVLNEGSNIVSTKSPFLCPFCLNQRPMTRRLFLSFFLAIFFEKKHQQLL